MDGIQSAVGFEGRQNRRQKRIEPFSLRTLWNDDHIIEILPKIPMDILQFQVLQCGIDFLLRPDKPSILPTASLRKDVMISFAELPAKGY